MFDAFVVDGVSHDLFLRFIYVDNIRLIYWFSPNSPSFVKRG
ncbi:DNA topoisomerase IV, A subunit [Aggregatibacter aphrophilus NJ8700]|nr:DNA topoisomerase IV, A subunit [Aggregatibacter aphrophilus NJ8700]